MVLLLFFCSGATALIYEVIWSKYLSLMFGSTIYAQTIVLAVFMGGLALGNRIIGGRADLLKRPLATYGYLEGIIGLYAFIFPHLYRFADGLFVSIGSGIFNQSALLLLFKALLSVCVLIIPTILMGGTLPLLAAWLQKHSTDAGRQSARFYSVNSLGAVAGSLLAGFFLVEWIGLNSTLEMTALANVLVGAIAVLLSRKQMVAAAETVSAESGEPVAADQKLLRRGCLMVALTGAISMGLEVLASRSLALLFGASLQAFAVVLIAFIFGIGVGSSVIASQRFRRVQNEAAVYVVMLAAAVWIGLLVFNIEGLFVGFRFLRSGLASSTMGYRYDQVLKALIALLVLGVPAGLLGSVLPLWMRIVSRNTLTLGSEVGRLLTWNTLGAVGGVLLTGFVIMPTIGLSGGFALLASALAVAAIVIALAEKRKVRLIVGLAALVFVAAAGVMNTKSWQTIVSSGIFRLRETEVQFSLSEWAGRRNILFYKDAPDATVTVETDTQDTNSVNLRINGKPDASSTGDMPTQMLLAHLPMAMTPNAKNVFVLGFGSGVTPGAVLGHPVEQIVIAENCEPVLTAGKFFEPWNHNVLGNPRVHVRREDARTVLKVEPQKYDVIICEPSNPWTAGIGSVFSKEFYDIAAQRLTDDGVICQWFHVYEMHDGIVFLVLRTFGSVFPNFEIWECNSGDILMVGAKKPFASGIEQYKRLFQREEVRRDLLKISIQSPEELWARQLASQRTAFAIAGPGAMQSDIFPVLEYEAPKAFFLGRKAVRLFTFDERTWQMDLASAEKRRALSSLDLDSLKRVLPASASANSELNGFLKLRFEHNDPVFWSSVSFPSLFRPTNAPPVTYSAPARADEAVRALTEGATLLERGDLRGAQLIEAALRSGKLTHDHAETVAQCTASAVRKYLAAGNRAKAIDLLELGLKAFPQADQLLYVVRVLEREQQQVSAR